jgi:hypothetical protein
MDQSRNTLLAVAWYRPEEYALLLALASDTASMAHNYDEWLAGVIKLMADLREQGIQVCKVDVSVRELAAWCEQQGRPIDGAARSEFAARKVRGEHQSKSGD